MRKKSFILKEFQFFKSLRASSFEKNKRDFYWDARPLSLSLSHHPSHLVQPNQDVSLLCKIWISRRRRHLLHPHVAGYPFTRCLRPIIFCFGPPSPVVFLSIILDLGWRGLYVSPLQRCYRVVDVVAMVVRTSCREMKKKRKIEYKVIV